MNRRDPAIRWWAITVAAGALVLAAVGGLLEVLRRTTRDVEVAVNRVWTAGKQLAQQTQAAHLLDVTKARTGALREALEATPEREGSP